MTEEQRVRVLEFSKSSCTIVEPSGEAHLHRAFELQAAAKPEHTALVCGARSLTYGQLNREANALAHWLLDQGSVRRTVIAGRLERSPDLVVFLLAVLKCGAICLPLDPEYPTERTRLILADAHPRLLFSRGSFSGIPTIDIDDARKASEAYKHSNPECGIGDDDPSFLLYTSGSTGYPKGVLMTAGGRARRQLWTQRRYNATESDRHLLKSPVGFGTLIRETFWPLTTGGTMLIPKPGGQRDVGYLIRIISEQGITIINFVPSLLGEFLDHPNINKCTPLRHVFCTGEALSVELQKRFQARLPWAQLHLFYGSTEAPTATYHDFSEPDSEPVITVGRPAGIPVYVLDESLEPVPIGMPGEICVGGPDLAHGYYCQPEMTAERFVPDPFANSSGARLFRTGDRGRWHRDGRLEYLGRVDEQVKVRGCRVELGEVREAILSEKRIQDAAAVSCDGRNGIKCIVAFYVPANQGPSARDLRRCLTEKLPAYMIPERLLRLDHLPLDSHGKIDRQALIRLAADGTLSRETGESPRGSLEIELAAIWCNALDLDSVGRNEIFFELGGHSITALRVLSSIREILGIDLPISELFARPTVRQLAEEIGRREMKGPSTLGTGHLRGNPFLKLSSAQRRLWFLHVLNPDSYAYNVPCAYEIYGELDLDALREKLNALVARHEVLRSSVVVTDGEPYQVFRPAAELTLSVDSGQKEQLNHYLAEFARRRLDLSATPQLHAKVFRIDEHRHVLALLLPHFACDRLSLDIIRSELFGKRHGREILQYSTFIEAEDQWLHTPAAKSAIESWKRQFSDGPGVMEIPGIVPLSGAIAAGQFHAAGSLSRPLPYDLIARLQSLSSRERCTQFTIFWAALAILIGRLTGKTDIVIGVPVDCRRSNAYDETIGCFVNPVPIRIDLSGALHFLDALQRAKEAIAHALTNAAVPFESIVEQINPERISRRNPLFEICFNFDGHEPAPTWCDVEIHSLDIPETGAKFDLNFYVAQVGTDWSVRLVFRSALYCADWASGVLENYEKLLNQIVSDPGRCIDDYSLVSASFRRHVPNLNAPINAAKLEPITAEFQRIASRQPEAPAVSCEATNSIKRRTITYGELAHDASDIATKLLELGLRTGDCVTLIGRHSPLLPAAMLGVWESGGIFLLLDESLPSGRRAVMMQEAGVEFVLRLITGEISRFSVPCCLERRQNNPTPVEGDTPACIFFTSGTSGPPKAVLFSHQGIAHFLAWEREALGVRSADRVPLLMPLSFDAILRDIFLPLSSGGVLCIPPDTSAVPWLKAEQITILHVVPSVAQAWIAGLVRPFDLPDLRWVLFSGEPLTGAFVRRWRENVSRNAAIINLYGPTETTMCKCFYIVPKIPDDGAQPVGLPMPSTQVMIMAENGRLAGMGEVGEIVLRTPFRTLGYLNSADLQQARFIANPRRPDDATDLLYRTGDWGRFRPDGLLEIRGRRDRQIKIRGARVELQEIELALAGLLGIAEAAVIAQTDVHGERRLAAYVVPPIHAHLDPAQIIDRLRQQLPSFMIPSSVMVLNEMPRTQTGKVDRDALPTTSHERPNAQKDFVSPRTLLELQLVHIWEELLHVDRVGVRDNFFELGGHSLLAIQMAARIENKLGYPVAPSSLFPDATIESLAHIIGRNTPARPWNTLVPIQPGIGRPILFCVHPAGGSVFCYADLARCIGPDHAVFGLQGPDPRSTSEPLDSVESIAAEYIQSLRPLQPQGPYFLVGFSFGGLIAFEMGQQLRNQGEPVAFVALLDTGYPDSPGALNPGGLVHELSRALEKHDLSDHATDEEEYRLWHDVGALARKYIPGESTKPGKHYSRGLGAVQECFRIYRLLPVGDDLSYGDVRRFLRFLRANLLTARNYRVTPTTNSLIFACATESMPGEVMLSEGRADFWRSTTSGDFELVRIPGNHVNMLAPPGVNVIASRLRARIEAAGKPSEL